MPGPKATSDQNIAKLLNELGDSPHQQRDAFFYCIMVLMRTAQDPCPIVSEGVWHGKILLQPQGDKGFGYDPIFYDSQYRASAAELPLEIKNQISHRGQAMQGLLKKLGSL